MMEIKSFPKGHHNCFLSFDNTNPVYIASSDIKCEELPYVDFLRSIENVSTSSIHLALAKSVLSFYTDLSRRLLPIILNEAYIKIRLPKYLKSLPHNILISRKLLIHPISFGIPEKSVRLQVPTKRSSFFSVIPGVQSTYYNLRDESHYFRGIAESLFSLTYKKAGWDCLRHYEILAKGSLPLFINIEACPKGALTMHPKNFYRLLLKFPGLQFVTSKSKLQTYKIENINVNFSSTFDKQFYSAIVMASLRFTKNVLSTKAIAQYVVNTMQFRSEGRIKKGLPIYVLYVTHTGGDDAFDRGDYMVDLLLHGMKELLGETFVVDHPKRSCVYKTIEHFNETAYIAERESLYGHGFSYAFKIDELSNHRVPNSSDIKNDLENHKYDMVLLGSLHRDGWWNEVPLWDIICQYYHRLEVGLIHGGDEKLDEKLLDKYLPCGEHIFSREGYRA